ncbi:HAD-IIB family hydrolase [Mesoplasma lactucae]|uniref:Uncharacterized protein n=1 Tax=Mesoplasma lactucae ATCC 49193 TaxID=81460 RepID=A0A291IRR1_9MOLU|nr:HAD-IIB family hydrolase [Mesoplasma lactucae]ATG97542.1 hypothetical protein CP520_02125 [Mesoplasma lactucae ATCC 49193]ATZ20000.1 hypothetical protein MLACT_v1c01780 [Mesoplasma lactucae ATCC 49193]MCL8217049.1 putative phosphatase [Mesoplasma lactucae ATCC 49193]
MEKWLVTDYDGTLRNGTDGGVDPKDLAFVKEFINDNNHVVIASGRPYEMILREAREMGIKPSLYITNAGAVIRDDNGKLLYKKTIPHDELKPVVDYLKTLNLHTLIYATPDEEMYLFTDNPSKYPDGSLKRRITNQSFDDLYDMDLVCFKIMEDRQTLDNLIKHVKKVAPDLTIINNNDSNLVEIHPPHSSKGDAVKIMQELEHLKPEQIITAGDDDNDITMLSWFDNSFVIKQPYNKEIQKYGKHKIDHLWEIKNYLGQN